MKILEGFLEEGAFEWNLKGWLSRAVDLKLQHASKSPGKCIKTEWSWKPLEFHIQEILSRGWECAFVSKFPSDAVASLGTALWEPLSRCIKMMAVGERPIVVVWLFGHALLFVIPWTTARQASWSFTISWSLLKLMCIESVIQSSHPLLSPSPTALNLSQHQHLFQWVGSWHQLGKVLELQLQPQSFQCIFRTDFL